MHVFHKIFKKKKDVLIKLADRYLGYLHDVI